MKLSVLLITLLGAALLASGVQAFADPLKNAYRERIGNYDVQMTTEPKMPVVGSPTNIQIRIAGVNGDDLVDIPITLRLAENGAELQKTTQIVPYGHYAYEYTFKQAGKYVLYVDLTDYNYSGQVLTFTFFVNVAGPFDYFYVIAPFAAAVAVGIAGAIFLMMRKKRQILK